MFDLKQAFKLFIAIIIVIIIWLLIHLIAYKYIGWTEFTMKEGENFNTKCDPQDVANIVFSNCKYTVKHKTDPKLDKTLDVTARLNNMVKAFKGNKNEDFRFYLAGKNGLDEYTFPLGKRKTLAEDTEFRNNYECSTDCQDDHVKLTGYYRLY